MFTRLAPQNDAVHDHLHRTATFTECFWGGVSAWSHLLDGDKTFLLLTEGNLPNPLTLSTIEMPAVFDGTESSTIGNRPAGFASGTLDRFSLNRLSLNSGPLRDYYRPATGLL